MTPPSSGRPLSAPSTRSAAPGARRQIRARSVGGEPHPLPGSRPEARLKRYYGANATRTESRCCLTLAMTAENDKGNRYAPERALTKQRASLWPGRCVTPRSACSGPKEHIRHVDASLQLLDPQPFPDSEVPAPEARRSGLNFSLGKAKLGRNDRGCPQDAAGKPVGTFMPW